MYKVALLLLESTLGGGIVRYPTGPPSRPSLTVLSVTRPGGGHRHLTHPDPNVLRAYQRAVARIWGRIERALGPEVIANRTDPRGGLRPFGPDRRRWRRAVERGLRTEPGAVLVTDVRACYPSIRPDAIERALRRIGAPDGDVVAWLHAFERTGTQGLPVGPEPSAVLANAALLIADEALRATGVAHVRWVDDLVVFAQDAGHALRARRELVEALAQIGLELNRRKTWILEDRRDARERLLGSWVEPSGIQRAVRGIIRGS